MGKLSIHYSGYCMANGYFIEKGRAFKELPFVALWGLFLSEKQGYVLIDTAYAKRNIDLTQRFPDSIYGKITEIHVSKENEVISTLRKKGISQSEVKHIIISHFHADHIGGLKDFPEATIWCKKEALDHILSYPTLLAFSKGYIKGLVPEDIIERVKYIDDLAVIKEKGLQKCWSFLDDELMLVDLPGHARGHIGVLHKSSKQFMVIDAAWTTENITELNFPRRIVSVFIDSYKKLKQSLKMLHDFHKENPEILMIPSHCPTIIKTHFNGEAKA